MTRLPVTREWPLNCHLCGPVDKRCVMVDCRAIPPVPASVPAREDVPLSADYGKNTSPEGKAMRFNEGKVPMGHVLDYPRAMAELAKVADYGANKYDRGNFQRGQKASVTIDCMMRHLWKWWCGEDYDPESMCHHLGHVVWNVMVLCEDMMRAAEGASRDNDDRTFKGDYEAVDTKETFGQ